MIASVAFESFGRRKTAAFGGILATFVTFVGMFTTSYGMMVPIRILQGKNKIFESFHNHRILTNIFLFAQLQLRSKLQTTHYPIGFHLPKIMFLIRLQ